MAALPRMMNSAQMVAAGKARFGGPPPQAPNGNSYGPMSDIRGPLGFNYAPQQQAHQQKLMQSYGTTNPQQIAADAQAKNALAMQNFQATNPQGFAQYQQNQGKLGNPVGHGGAADYMARIRQQEMQQRNPGYTPFALGGASPKIPNVNSLLVQMMQRFV